MSEFEKWSADTWVIKPLHEIIAEYNALHTAWQESQTELERIGKINDSMCDTIAELEARIESLNHDIKTATTPIRVPFTGAQIEALAEVVKENISQYWYESSCHERIAAAVRARVEAPLLAEIAEHRRHVGTVMAREAELKARVAELEAERDNAEMAAGIMADDFNSAQSELAALREQLAILHPGETVEGVVMERDSYRIQLEAAQAERDAIQSTFTEVNNAYHEAHKTRFALQQELAAHAVLPVPAGVPSAEELVRAGNIGYDACPGAHHARDLARAEAILTALRPWIREPTGWELDVTADELAPLYWRARGTDNNIREFDQLCQNDKRLILNGLAFAIDLCRSRIRPTFECKECAKKEAELRRHNDKWTGFIQRCQANAQNARAALEGE